jgi:hypothetical protein
VAVSLGALLRFGWLVLTVDLGVRRSSPYHGHDNRGEEIRCRLIRFAGRHSRSCAPRSS